MENAYLIAGLGNPGSEYARTRHNAGFMAVERFADGHGAFWKPESQFQARLARTDIEGRRVILCEPQTFMNRSGLALQKLAAFYRIPASRVLVVVDDADLVFGQIRLRGSGSSGGHHGLESIEQHLGTRDYARLRIGIGRRADGVREITDYVLERFQAREKRLLEAILERVCRQIECWITAGVGQAMNAFNGVVETPLKNES